MKLACVAVLFIDLFVAPHGGAWIETPSALIARAMCMSPLTEGRGLKRQQASALQIALSSPLTEGRGLKLFTVNVADDRHTVAPHGGAWIETELRLCQG